MIDPLEFITRLREIYPERYEVDSNGCLKFHLLLKAMYPNATGWYDGEHIITQIGSEIFDIDGFAERMSNYLPMEQYGSWDGFTHIHRQMEIH